jgi:hypothetical protein
MLRAFYPRHKRMQEELIAAEIEVAPGSFSMIVLWAIQPALRASPWPAPFEANIDSLALTIELGFGDVPGILNPKQLLEEFGVAHGEELRRRRKFLSPAHPNSRRPA